MRSVFGLDTFEKSQKVFGCNCVAAPVPQPPHKRQLPRQRNFALTDMAVHHREFGLAPHVTIISDQARVVYSLGAWPSLSPPASLAPRAAAGALRPDRGFRRSRRAWAKRKGAAPFQEAAPVFGSFVAMATERRPGAN